MTFEPTGSAPEADFSSKTFLIVDDFQGMRTILRDILRSCGANAKNISTAGHGTEAINLLSYSYSFFFSSSRLLFSFISNGDLSLIKGSA